MDEIADGDEETTEDIRGIEQVAAKGKVVVPCITLNRMVTRLRLG
jgi:S-adenosylhomocysteine hydrolase